MGWQRGNNIHLNSVTPKSGMTMLAVWDTVASDDLGVTWTRGGQKAKDNPTTNLKNGYTEHVVVA
jgi:hypothetical protein